MMNNKLSTGYLMLIMALMYCSCRSPRKDEKPTYSAGAPLSMHTGNEKYIAVNKKESVVTWKGSNSFGTHRGYVYLSKGELLMEEGKLMGGAVEVDMATIEDDSHGKDNGLINHLKDPDFFDVKKFPLSTIIITGSQATMGELTTITANLSIKGITRPVSFPARIEVSNGIVTATGKVILDRTLWGIRYNSGKFFDNLKNESISDFIEFDIKIVAGN